MKFLNDEGLGRLWSKISDNNTILVDAINAKANKNNVVSLGVQELTDTQKKQVKKNLDIQNPGEITKKYEYAYQRTGTFDENTEYVYVDAYPDRPFLVKVGEIPEGEINYIGSTVINHRLDSDKYVTTEITEEVMNRSLTLWGESAVTVQPGLIQIMEHLDPYFSETEWEVALCICTRPGRYLIAFGGWVSYVTFPYSGIFFREGEYGYYSTISFSTTVTFQTEDSNDSTILNPVNYKGNEIQAFTRGLCIGDSVTEGTMDHSEGTFNKKGTSYPVILKRLTGLDIVNAGISGATSETWYQYSLDSTGSWGKWVDNEWSWGQSEGTSLDYSGFDFAIIHLGINDRKYVLEDNISAETVLVNYKINMNKIITKLKEYNKGIKIFIATIIPSYAPSTDVFYQPMNNIIKEIVEETEDAYLLDINLFSNVANNEAYNVWHPTAIGYAKLAEEIKSLICYQIKQNLEEFENIQFIGTDYII